MFREFHDYPLPLAHSSDAAGTPLRSASMPVALDDRSLAGFLQLAEELAQAPLGLDATRLASAAHWLLAHYPGRRDVPCIRVRMHAAAALRAMQADRDWSLDPALVPPLQRLAAYFRAPQRLIPAQVPVIGHLDDAILVDTLWPRLEGELREYLDYRRLRRIEAELQGIAPHRLRFSRRDWQRARDTERALLAQFRHTGLDSYTDGMAPTPRFSVH
jgi:uncharacterized membrane protein YkvA (DUF1232 family)